MNSKPIQTFRHYKCSSLNYKENPSLLSAPISFIINLSFNKDIFPEKLKIVQVAPVCEKNETDLCCKYQRISLLSIVNKHFQKKQCKALHIHLALFIASLITSFPLTGQVPRLYSMMYVVLHYIEVRLPRANR